MNAIEAVVSFRTRTFRSSITRPANTDVYAAGDAICAVTTNDHFTFGAASNDNTKTPGRMGGPLSGTINSVRLHSSANQATKLQGELWLFTSDIVNVADNAAFAPTDAEMLTLVAIVPIPLANWYVGDSTAGSVGNAVAVVIGIDMSIITAGNGILYGQLVARNSYAPVSGEVFTCDLGWRQD